MTALILASSSPTRKNMLSAAGLSFTVEAADIDEASVRDELTKTGASCEVAAEALARSKAMAISNRSPDALVIGADQILDCDGIWFSKPESREAARTQLKDLRGRRHDLVSAVVIARGARTIWSHAERARLTMRAFSDAFLDDYLNRAGDNVTASVGAYLIEGLGAQLFEHVEGSHFTILGLPLLPLLAALRQEGALPI